jgi:ubiquinone/menaquinone biosynthesis C-methylase UbiE
MIARGKPASNLHFKLMSLGFKFRDFFLPRKNILKEIGIKPGYRVLDFGCGPGAYITGTSELVGRSGIIYALDIHPLAIQMVQSIASKNKLKNIEIIQSDCKTQLPDNSIDVVLLYDVIHGLGDRNRVLEELHRVLKPTGILSLSDHHLKQNEIISNVTSGGLFSLSNQGKKTYTFFKK